MLLSYYTRINALLASLLPMCAFMIDDRVVPDPLVLPLAADAVQTPNDSNILLARQFYTSTPTPKGKCCCVSGTATRLQTFYKRI